MDRYIRRDAQASSCTLGVTTPSVQRVGSRTVGTRALYLVEAGRQRPQLRYICSEEGTLS